MTLGFRWGLGHSAGLVSVAILFIALKGNLDLRKIGRYCDGFVGASMIILGFYGVIGTFKSFQGQKKKLDLEEGVPLIELQESDLIQKEKLRRNSPIIVRNEQNPLFPRSLSQQSMNYQQNNSEDPSLPNELDDLPFSTSSSFRSKSTTPSFQSTLFQSISTIGDPQDFESELIQQPSSPLPLSSRYLSSPPPSTTTTTTTTSSTLTHHNHHHHLLPSHLPFLDMKDPFTQRVASFVIGLLHGVAGPGGVLGVLPAVEMESWSSSLLYLFSFVVTSTLSMGCFSALYGELTRRVGASSQSVEMGLSLFSSGLSMLVGVVWLGLSIIGKLEDFFH